MESYKKLAGKVVIITGASSGIGRAAAVEFAKLGSLLSLTGRNKERLDAAAQECFEAGLSLDKVLTNIADVNKEEDIKRIVDSTLEKFGTVNVLVNNAGTFGLSNVADSSVSDLDYMYSEHVKSVYLLTQLCLEHLKKNKGSIVNVSSIQGVRPGVKYYAYGMAKAAQDHLTRLLALDLAKFGVRVNGVNPGFIKTNIFKSVLDNDDEQVDKFYDEIGPTQPLGRMGESEEVAQPIVFFASEASSFITGTTTLIDGGLHVTHTEPKQ